MLNLASMIMAGFFFMHTAFHVKGVPMPVVIEHGSEYSYNEISSEIEVPDNWQGTCDSQKEVLIMMGKHFNAFLNGNQKKPDSYINSVVEKWVCVE